MTQNHMNRLNHRGYNKMQKRKKSNYNIRIEFCFFVYSQNFFSDKTIAQIILLSKSSFFQLCLLGYSNTKHQVLRCSVDGDLFIHCYELKRHCDNSIIYARWMAKCVHDGYWAQGGLLCSYEFVVCLNQRGPKSKPRTADHAWPTT